MRNKFKELFFCISVMIVLFYSMQAWAAQSGTKSRRVEEGKRGSLDLLSGQEKEILLSEDRLIMDYGGWLDIRYEKFKDADNDSTTEDTFASSLSVDTRFWTRFTLKPPAGASYPNEHVFYFRVKNIYSVDKPEESTNGKDNDGPHIDYAYAVIDLRPFSVEAGRKYYMVGQGIAYGNVNDGAELILNLNNWTFRGFVSRTLPNEDNVDTSVPEFQNNGDRSFFAAEATYVGLYGHGIYGYVLAQRDGGGTYPSEPARDYTYDSEYFGLGLQGKLLPQVHYWAEAIRQTGQSHVYDTGQAKDVDAWASDIGVTWDIDLYSHPNLTFEYAYGSGDGDRESVTDTQYGNVLGDDNNFLYFGYLPAGYALSPRLSNLRFFKVSLLAKPLEAYRRFNNLTFGIDYYRYYKNNQNGAISDADATLPERYIGSELDVRIAWKMFSDLSWALEFGRFSPGDAYPAAADDPELYISLGTTLTF